MFTRISQSGGRSYLQLVESFRNDAGQPRQRVVANLGRVDQLTPKDLDPLINGLDRALGRQRNAAPVVEFVTAKSLGDVYALHALWKALGLADALRRSLRSSRRRFDAEALIRAMVFNRLCEPESKLGVLRWLGTVAMPDMPEAVSHDHLLRAMDALIDRAEAVESAVAQQLHPLFDDAVAVVFYDLITIQIAGSGEVTDDARKYGLSKDTGSIARQFVLDVIQTAEGFPIAHEVHADNVGEVTTLLPVIEQTIARYALKRLVLLADRGLLSLDNLAAIEALKTHAGAPVEFILAVPGRRYCEFAEVARAARITQGLAETIWQGRRLVIVHDDVRASEQRAAHERVSAPSQPSKQKPSASLNRSMRMTRARHSLAGARTIGVQTCASQNRSRLSD